MPDAPRPSLVKAMAMVFGVVRLLVRPQREVKGEWSEKPVRRRRIYRARADRLDEEGGRR